MLTVFFGALIGAEVLLSLVSASAGTYRVVHAFCSQANCADGAVAHAGVIADSTGNLYGTTLSGGASGSGTVFRIAPDGTETVLYSFCKQTNCADGAAPYAGSVMDGAGNLYGATACGGTNGCGYGTVFKLAPDSEETVLHAFTGGKDGADPNDLILDKSGNLYGTTELGGNGCNGMGCGTVFRISAAGREKILYRFCSLSNCADGSFPWSALVFKSGKLYGTTVNGGAQGEGTVFQLSGSTETVLYSFCAQGNCADGANPYAKLLLDKTGNFYGTTTNGGANSAGTIFKLAPGGAETVLYSFCSQPNCSDGSSPFAGLVSDADGNLYGTTQGGGSGSFSGQCNGCGVVFELAGNGTETVLYAFCSKKECMDGGSFLAGMAGLIRAKSGRLYGTTPQFGGNAVNGGVVFTIGK
jgi:uncharacterized repeat protein (TIGR03803 family)